MNKKNILLVAPLFLQGCLLDNRDHSACAPAGYTAYSTADEHVATTDTYNNIFTSDHEDLTINGDLIIEGDIVIQTDRLHPELVSPLSAITKTRIWPEGIVYYSISDDLPRQGRVHHAIDTWEELTGGLVQFVERVDEPNYIEVINDDGCYSNVGMTGTRQYLSLGDGCSAGTAIHEFGHALGLWHEQSRRDRDEYVKINWCNIQDGKQHNFSKKSEDRVEDVGAYDYASIMHYVRSSFTTNIFATIQSKTGTPVPVFPKSRPSAGDVDGVIALYSVE